MLFGYPAIIPLETAFAIVLFAQWLCGTSLNIADGHVTSLFKLKPFTTIVAISARDTGKFGLNVLSGYPASILLSVNLFISQLEPEERTRRLEDFFRAEPVGVIVTSSIEISPEMVSMAERYEVPLLRTAERTSPFMAAIIAFLNVQLGPRLTRHGVLVEVYGEGILLLGDSGLGKSETAIELLKRGHRLIADDAVEIKRVSATTLVGQAPEIIRHYVELRGIGIVDVRRLFGMGAVKESEKIDMVINLEPWENGKMYDRLGLDEETTDILGIEVPSIVLPVCPGRNLSVVIEVAAMNNRLKRMGYNTAKEFNKRLMESMGGM